MTVATERTLSAKRRVRQIAMGFSIAIGIAAVCSLISPASSLLRLSDEAEIHDVELASTYITVRIVPSRQLLAEDYSYGNFKDFPSSVSLPTWSPFALLISFSIFVTVLFQTIRGWLRHRKF